MLQSLFNRIVVFGGMDSDGVLTNETYIMSIDKKRKEASCYFISYQGVAPKPRHSHAACFCPSCKLV